MTALSLTLKKDKVARMGVNNCHSNHSSLNLRKSKPKPRKFLSKNGMSAELIRIIKR